MNKRFFYLLLAIPLVVSCGGGSGDETEIPDSVRNKVVKATSEVDKSVINDLVQNVSSPIEMAALIKNEGVPFSKDYLSDADNVDNFNTAFEKAINLGVYGADLGYMNIYDKTSLIINHITSIKKIAEDLKIGQFFDFSTLKRLASNNENLDSLMYISTSSFNRMDKWLGSDMASSAARRRSFPKAASPCASKPPSGRCKISGRVRQSSVGGGPLGKVTCHGPP